MHGYFIVIMIAKMLRSHLGHKTPVKKKAAKQYNSLSPGMRSNVETKS